MSIRTITPQQLEELRRSGRPLDLIDVRTPVEYREVHALGACNVPLETLDVAAVMHARNGAIQEPVYVICRSGGRGKQACEKFLAAGHGNILNVDGGTMAWEAAGLPVVRDAKTISLERQVRIVAGFLVLVSTVLALTVHPYFAALSGFFGAGLMIAGITDTCGMALILAKMPWNQKSHTGLVCCAK